MIMILDQVGVVLGERTRVASDRLEFETHLCPLTG